MSVLFLCCTNFVYSLSWQVLKDGGRWSGARRGPFFVGAWSEVFDSSAPLRRALLDSMSTPPGPSSSTTVPSRGQGRKRGGGARGRGRGGRVTLTAPSSPPPPTVSPEHVTARVESSEEDATWTPVHEPRVDGPSAHESSAHETPEEHMSGWGT